MKQLSPGTPLPSPSSQNRLPARTERSGVLVNDIHSKLNPTNVDKVIAVKKDDDIALAIHQAASSGGCLSIAGGRHAMGAQQFGTASTLIYTTSYNSILAFDRQAGLVKVQSGMQWQNLVNDLIAMQEGSGSGWGIKQKQTGADNLSLGGAVSANAHGRGLKFTPMVGDVESFEILDACARKLEVSRNKNRDLFKLAVGGYGLFGVITSVTLRLSRRIKLMRNVQIVHAAEVMDYLEKSRDGGAAYGDFQFAIDNSHPDFLNRGILSTYSPADPSMPATREQRRLSTANWRHLVYLAHTDKRRAFQEYSSHYLSTAGQIYWSDTHQLSTYLDDYHSNIGGACRKDSSEIITEVYVPRSCLAFLLSDLKTFFRERNSNVIYGTVRLIEKDTETFLAWADKSYACIVLNLHVDHSPEELKTAKKTFQYVYDAALNYGGSFFLTYHRFARKDQILACYPQFPDFLELKKKYDPEEVFLSDWYRHYKKMFDT